jgi:hypothetical protein
LASGVAARQVKQKVQAKNRVFTICIWAALEMKLGKSAKRARQQNLPNTPRIAQSKKDSEELKN